MNTTHIRKYRLLLPMILGAILLITACKTAKKQDTFSSKNISLAPGIYPMDHPSDLKAYFDTLEELPEGKICPLYHDSTEMESIRTGIEQLHQYAQGMLKYYPKKSVNEALNTMVKSLGYQHMHNDVDEGLPFFYRYLEQATRFCPDISFLADMKSADDKAGILYYETTSMGNPLCSFFLYQEEDGYKLEMIDSIGSFKVEKIFQLKDEQGQTYYLCSNNSCDLYFGQYLYGRTNGKMKLMCYRRNFISGYPPEDDYEIIFNPKKICWQYCTKKGELYQPMTNTSALYLDLKGRNSAFREVW